MRFIALWLVDPHIRTISTANVPPQQHDWWTKAVFGSSADEQKSAAAKFPAEVTTLLREKGIKLPEMGMEKPQVLPAELMDMVRSEYNDNLGTLSLEEARNHRLKLMEERTTYRGELLGRPMTKRYNFRED